MASAMPLLPASDFICVNSHTFDKHMNEIKVNLIKTKWEIVTEPLFYDNFKLDNN